MGIESGEKQHKNPVFQTSVCYSHGLKTQLTRYLYTIQSELLRFKNFTFSNAT